MPGGPPLTAAGPPACGLFLVSSHPSSAPLDRHVPSPAYVQISPPTPRQAPASGPHHRPGRVATPQLAFRGMDWGGVLCRPGMGSELEYQECRVLGVWIKALNYVGSSGGHRLWCNIPLACRLCNISSPHGARRRRRRTRAGPYAVQSPGEKTTGSDHPRDLIRLGRGEHEARPVK